MLTPSIVLNVWVLAAPWSAARTRVPGARGALVTHLLLALGVIGLDVAIPPARWFYGLSAAALLGAAFGLHRTGLKQVESRFLAVCAERVTVPARPGLP